MKRKKTNKTKGSRKQKKKTIRKTKVLQKKTQKKVPKVQTEVPKGEPTLVIESNHENQDKNCCMCMQLIDNKFFNPSKCLQQHGSRAHRVCGECWWGEFAKEGTNHFCPGCEKGLPLPSKITKKTKPGITINLVDDE